jgi:rhodanese-related sulfurtransferase
VQVGLLASVAVSLTLIFHSFSDSGYFNQGAIVQMIAKSRLVSPARELDLAQFRSRLDTGATIVDARFTSDFLDGHVPGALNIPPDTSHVDRGRLLKSVGHPSTVVVYCAGPACPYAAILANRLTRDGFPSVEVFAGGWEEWSKPTSTFTSIAENK